MKRTETMTGGPSNPSATFADLKTMEAVANVWVRLVAAADGGDAKAQGFLLMFAPFAKERLGLAPKS